MPKQSVPGAVLDVEMSDEGGHPVVQLHGLMSSRRRDRLLDLDLGIGLSGTRLLRYDARGHGRSTGRPVPDDYRWPVLAGDLLILLETWFPGEKVHGAGSSMGVGTLLHAAVMQPDRFSGFTLLLPPTAWETRAAQSVNYMRRADLVEREGVEAFIALDADAPQPPATLGRPDTTPDISKALLPSALRGAAMSNFPARRQITGITAAATILTWTEDSGHPLSTARALLDLLPNASLQVATRPEDVAGWPRILSDDVAGDSVPLGG